MRAAKGRRGDATQFLDSVSAVLWRLVPIEISDYESLYRAVVSVVLRREGRDGEAILLFL